LNTRELVKKALKSAGYQISRLPDSDESKGYHPSFVLTPKDVEGMDRNTRRVLNLINYTKTSNSSYSAQPYENAYHSIELNGVTYAGQRDPKGRFEEVGFDFTNKSVLDIGCNQGGMIFELADKISHGVGIDYDQRMINAANRLRSYRKASNVDFFVFDLETENLNLIDNFLPNQRVDIVFLLSVCMWIKDWHSVIDKALELADHLLFESNGTPEQQDEQEAYLQKTYGTVTMIRDSSPDDERQKSRKLYLCNT